MSRLEANQMLAGPPRPAASGDPLTGPITGAPDAQFVIVHHAACRTVFLTPRRCQFCDDEFFPRTQTVWCDWCDPG